MIPNEKTKQNWNKRGFSCDTWTDPPGQEWLDYVHDTDELLMLIEGELELTLNGKAFQVKYGEEVFIPARSIHSVKNTGKSKNIWLYGYKR